MAGVGAPHPPGAGVGVPSNGARGGIRPPRGKAVPVTGGRGAPHTSIARSAAYRAGGNPNDVANRPVDWLQPLTPRQVVNQATSMVKTAYQPAYNALSQQQNMENGILTKQEADNQFYQQWLDNKSNALLANEQQVNLATQRLEQQLTGNQMSEFGQELPNLVNEANSRPGNVGGATVTPGGELQANQQGMETELGAAAQQSNAMENVHASALGAAIANTGAVVNAGQAREVGAYNTAMMKIANEQSVLGSREASALTTELTRLQGTQIALSENNRNYNTAVAKLGIQTANVSSEIANRAATQKLNQQKFQETVSQNQFNDAVKNQQLQQNAERIAISLANSNANIAYKNAQIAKDRNGGTLSLVSQNVLFNKIQSAEGTINGLIQQGMPANAAYAAVLNGYYVTTKTLASGKKEQIRVGVPRLSNQQLLNAAYNISAANNNIGLTQGDVAALQAMMGPGANIGSRLKIAGPSAPPATGSSASLPGNGTGGKFSPAGA